MLAMLSLTVCAGTGWRDLESACNLPWLLQFETTRHKDSDRDILAVSQDIKFFLDFQQRCGGHQVEDDVVAYQLSFHAVELNQLLVHRIASRHTLRSGALMDLAALSCEAKSAKGTVSATLSELQGLHSEEGTKTTKTTKRVVKKDEDNDESESDDMDMEYSFLKPLAQQAKRELKLLHERIHQDDQRAEATLLADPGSGCIDVSTTEFLATLSRTLQTLGQEAVCLSVCRLSPISCA